LRWEARKPLVQLADCGAKGGANDGELFVDVREDAAGVSHRMVDAAVIWAWTFVW